MFKCPRLQAHLVDTGAAVTAGDAGRHQKGRVVFELLLVYSQPFETLMQSVQPESTCGTCCTSFVFVSALFSQ